MNELQVARGLGWFSIGLGLTEIVAGKQLGQALGMEDKTWLLRLFGLREIAAGVGILSRSNPTPWVWARVAGDALDIASVASAYTDDNPKKETVGVALAVLASVTALDAWCAKKLQGDQGLGSDRTHRSIEADGSSRQHRSIGQPSGRPRTTR